MTTTKAAKFTKHNSISLMVFTIFVAFVVKECEWR